MLYCLGECLGLYVPHVTSYLQTDQYEVGPGEGVVVGEDVSLT